MSTVPKKVVLLDLDGTLTDSAQGILASVKETFKALGMPVPDAAELQRFVGRSAQATWALSRSLSRTWTL